MAAHRWDDPATMVADLLAAAELVENAPYRPDPPPILSPSEARWLVERGYLRPDQVPPVVTAPVEVMPFGSAFIDTYYTPSLIGPAE